jgi:polyhydroxybutyrate depolymerase
MRLIIGFFALAGATTAAEPLAEKEWQIDGVARKALVYAPPAATAPAPLVFAFHGHGGSMANAAKSFRVHALWPEAVVVYPQGLNTPGRLTDPEGKRPGWQHGRGAQDDRDLKFFDAMLASLKKNHKIDGTRIYSTGHSNGGGFTYLLWAARPDVFAAVAPSSAAPGADGKALTPKPALHLAGEADALVKYEWQQAAVALVRKVNGCDAGGKEWATAGKLVGTVYPSKGGTPVVTLTHPGGHQFPADAPGLIVKFFKEHEKK